MTSAQLRLIDADAVLATLSLYELAGLDREL